MRIDSNQWIGGLVSLQGRLVICLRLLSLATALILAVNLETFAASPTVETDAVLKTLNAASVMLVDREGRVRYEFNAAEPVVPASTVKLLTTAVALDYWGSDYRFRTTLFYDSNTRTLWVEGSGDPYLVSEELAIMAQMIKAALGNRVVSAIGTNDTLFDLIGKVPGQSLSDNPYDALPSALAANFNTLNLQWQGGEVISAEAQTPLTSFAKQRVKVLMEAKKRLGSGENRALKHPIGRINIGHDEAASSRHFSSLLVEFLRKAGVSLAPQVVFLAARRSAPGLFPDMILEANPNITPNTTSDTNSDTTSDITLLTTRPIPRHLQPLITYENSRTLGEVVVLMLKYSNNFIANQIALTVAARSLARPANFDHVKAVFDHYVNRHFAWHGSVIQEGAGLSSDNRLSALQLIGLTTRLAQRYSHIPDLFPEYGNGVYAKTGTLMGVSTLAGYLKSKTGELFRFAILLNDRSIESPATRNRVLESLKKFSLEPAKMR